jgi:hypothetical protein
VGAANVSPGCFPETIPCQLMAATRQYVHDAPPPGYGWGGVSGGPVFALVQGSRAREAFPSLQVTLIGMVVAIAPESLVGRLQEIDAAFALTGESLAIWLQGFFLLQLAVYLWIARSSERGFRLEVGDGLGREQARASQTRGSMYVGSPILRQGQHRHHRCRGRIDRDRDLMPLAVIGSR